MKKNPIKHEAGTDTDRANKTVPFRSRAPHEEILESEKLSRKYRKTIAQPFPERRKTNKFRESHSRNE